MYSLSLSIAAFLGSALTTHSQRSEVRIPVAPPAIQIEGRSGQVVPKPYPLTVKLRVDGQGNLIIPGDINAAIEQLWSGLPSEYKEAIAWTHGFEKKNKQRRPNTTILTRTTDLGFYLRRAWKTDDETTSLGRELKCMNTGESEIQPVLTMMTRYIISEGYQRRSDVPKDVDLNRVFDAAFRLSSLCRDEFINKRALS